MGRVKEEREGVGCGVCVCGGVGCGVCVRVCVCVCVRGGGVQLRDIHLPITTKLNDKKLPK